MEYNYNKIKENKGVGKEVEVQIKQITQINTQYKVS